MTTIRYESNQIDVQDIINRYENRQLNLNPGFQRDSVWSERDRQKLIDSILRGYPLPSIFLYRRDDEGKQVFDVIDGKQRIETILMFMGHMHGRRFRTKAQLPGSDKVDWVDWNTIKRKRLQHWLTGYKLQTIEVTGDLAVINDVFVRINSTGKALTGAEQRHAGYYESEFLKRAAKLASRYEPYFTQNRIVSAGQLSRMKLVELMCELLVSADAEGPINKKLALDKAMEGNAISGRRLDKAARRTIAALNRVKKVFPRLRATRFHRISDFYSLAILFQRFEREGLILTDRKRNRLAEDLLVAFATGVDEVSLLQRQAKGVKPEQELYREYLLTVREGTEEISHRRKREQILNGLLATLFEGKDSARLFSPEQRRILWNSSESRRCAACRRLLTWEDFTIDHVNPHSKGGRTALENAALMCRSHNSAKGNRRIRRAA